jgi:hypothetical protein
VGSPKPEVNLFFIPSQIYSFNRLFRFNGFLMENLYVPMLKFQSSKNVV